MGSQIVGSFPVGKIDGAYATFVLIYWIGGALDDFFMNLVTAGQKHFPFLNDFAP